MIHKLKDDTTFDTTKCRKLAGAKGFFLAGWVYAFGEEEFFYLHYNIPDDLYSARRMTKRQAKDLARSIERQGAAALQGPE